MTRTYAFRIKRDPHLNVFGMDIDNNAIVQGLVENTNACNSGICKGDQIISINLQHVTTGLDIYMILREMTYVVFTITR